MPTRPIDAYWQGRRARRDRPGATAWDRVLPYATRPLADAWLDGWYDEAGVSRHNPGSPDRPPPASDLVGKAGGICPECWSPSSMTDLPDGVLRCRHSPCRGRNYPPVDREKAKVFLARRDAGSYI